MVEYPFVSPFLKDVLSKTPIFIKPRKLPSGPTDIQGLKRKREERVRNRTKNARVWSLREERVSWTINPSD